MEVTYDRVQAAVDERLARMCMQRLDLLQASIPQLSAAIVKLISFSHAVLLAELQG